MIIDATNSGSRFSTGAPGRRRLLPLPRSLRSYVPFGLSYRACVAYHVMRGRGLHDEFEINSEKGSIHTPDDWAFFTVYTLSGCIGKVVASHAEVARTIPG